MQKIIAQVLIALLLMPSLVCAMSACPISGQEIQAAEKPHCAEKSQPDTFMLLVDCMGVDLQQSPVPFQIAAPTFSHDLNNAASLEFWSAPGAEHLQFHANRGSPTSQNSTPLEDPIYRVTQRFRL